VSALEWLEDPDEEPQLGPTPRQDPKLSDLEAALVRARETRQARIEWLMAPEAPEMQSLLYFRAAAWHQRAASRGAGPDLLFPEPGSHRPVEALVHCAGCPVRQAGVRGATSGRDRKDLRHCVA